MRRLAPALLTAAILAGCGSGLASPVTLRKHATDVCKDASLVNVPANPTLIGPLRSFLSRGTANLEAELGQLQRLSAPSGEVGAVYGAALRALAAEVGALRAANAVIKRGQDPATAFKALQAALAPLEKQADNAWVALQIPACLER